MQPVATVIGCNVIQQDPIAGRAQPAKRPAQRAEIDTARAEILATRQQLRAVQLELRRDIERLETRLRLLNIVAVPAVLTLFALGLAYWRARRRRAARA